MTRVLFLDDYILQKQNFLQEAFQERQLKRLEGQGGVDADDNATEQAEFEKGATSCRQTSREHTIHFAHTQTLTHK